MTEKHRQYKQTKLTTELKKEFKKGIKTEKRKKGTKQINKYY